MNRPTPAQISLMLRIALGSLLVVTSSCQLDQRISRDKVITCSDGVCPPGYRCNAALARCLLEADFDDTPPAIQSGTVSLRLFAPLRSPLIDVSALGLGGQARIGFSVSEPLGATPLVADLPGLTCAASQSSLLSYDLSCTVAAQANPPQQVTVPRVTLVDLTGNRAEIALTEAGFEVDTVDPAPADVDDLAQVSVMREPWGSSASQGIPRRELRGVAAALEPQVRAVATDEAGTQVIARTDVNDDGSFGPLALPLGTDDDTWVRAVDRAGNTSPVRQVRNRAVTASVYGVIPHAPQSSPHRFTTYEVQGPSVMRTDGKSLGEADLLRGARSTTFVEGGSAWSQQWLEVPEGWYGRAGFASDPASARVVRFGGRTDGQPRAYSRLYELRDESWHSIVEEDLESDGSPPNRTGTALVMDTFRNEFVLFGGLVALPGPIRTAVSGDTWTLSGRSWRSHVTGQSPIARLGHALGYDVARRQTILVGGTDSDGGLLDDTWSWDGERWTELVDAGTPGRVFDGALMWNANLQGLLLAGGREDLMTSRTTTWLFDGTWHQLDAGTVPFGSVSAAWDSARGVNVLTTNSLQTWEFDGRWQQKAPVPGPAERNPVIAFDAARGVTVTPGAWVRECDGGSCVEHGIPTLTWDGTRWSPQGQVVPLTTSASFTPLATAAALGGVYAVGAGAEAWLWKDLMWQRRADSATPDAGQMTSTRDGGLLLSNQDGLFAHDGTSSWVTVGGARPFPGLATSIVELNGQRVFSGSAGGSHYLFDPLNGWRTTLTPGANVKTVGLPDGTALASAGTGTFALGSLFLLSTSSDGGITRSATGRSVNLYPAWGWDEDRRQLVSFSGFPSLLSSAAAELTIGDLDGGLREISVDDPLGHGGPRPRGTASLAFDPSTHRLILGPGGDMGTPIDDLWEYSSWGRRPAAVMHVDVTALAVPPRAELTRLLIVTRAGGRGFQNGAALTGARLQLFRDGAWWDVPGALNAATPSSPAVLQAEVSDVRELLRLFSAQPAVWVAVVPRGVTEVESAQLATEALEVSVEYRVP